MWMLATISSLSHPATVVAPQMDVLMVFGFMGSIVTLLCWMHQAQSRTWVLSFAVCLAAMAVYAFLQGAWPLGIVESVWSVATVRKWWNKKRIGGRNEGTFLRAVEVSSNRWVSEARMSRMFGSN
jgi:hypothetical protein